MSVVEAIGHGSLGLAHGEVSLADSDPRWHAAFERLAAELARALDKPAIEHVGSTAVAGLRAKPILDVAVGVPSPVAQELAGRLEPLGFELRGEAGDEGGILFVLEDRPAHRVVHVHVVERGGAQWERYLAFRERLRRDAAARAEYAELKESLAARFPHERCSYTAGKQAFIEALLADELARR